MLCMPGAYALATSGEAMSDAEFTVYQVFVGSLFEKATAEPVSAQEAVRKANDLTRTVGARIGSTCRVFITDGEDYIVWEWRYGEGLVFPPRLSL